MSSVRLRAIRLFADPTDEDLPPITASAASSAVLTRDGDPSAERPRPGGAGRRRHDAAVVSDPGR